MSLKTRIDTVQGPVVTNNGTGISIERNTENRGFGPFPVDSVPIIGSSTLVAGSAGVNVISGSGVQTVVLPTAVSCPGAEFVFRVGSAAAHIVTSSLEATGSVVIVSGSVAGAKITLASSVGSSVILKSTGAHFIVVGNFGNNPVS